MPRNGAGSYSLPTGNPVVTGTAISSTVQNNTMTDVATALTQSLAKDGQTTPSSNLPMGSFRHTGVGNGVARTDYPSIGQVQDSSFMWCGTATGAANALLLVPTPIVPAIAAGQRFVFKSGAAPNSGATTASISTLPTIAVQVNGAACAGGEILADKWYEVLVDASLTSCQLQKIGRATLTELGISAFAQTYLDDADAATTRATISAAKSGANSDITSLLGLTTPISGTLIGVQVFTSSGTYTPTSGMQSIIAEGVGGGGAGGGVQAVGAAQWAQSNGGGSGAYAKGRFTAAQVGASKSVTIGAGGTPVIGSTGGDGGTTSLGTLMTMPGGGGGTQGTPTSTSVLPMFSQGRGTSTVVGDQPSGGNILSLAGGRCGPAGISTSGSFSFASNGGDTLLGYGGLGSTGIGGVSAPHPGGGGGGVNTAISFPAYAGGNGGAGKLIIWEYA